MACFCPFSRFLGHKTFFQNIQLSRTTWKGFLAPCQIQRNLMIHSKKTPGQTTRWKDGQTLLRRIVLATARGWTSTTAVYITVSMQKLSSIYKYTDCNWTRTHNHLIHKQTLNHLAKPASAPASSKPNAPNAPNAPASSKEFFNIQANVECGFTLKHVCDMTRTCSYKHILTIQKISESHKLNDHAHLNKL